MDKRVLVVAAVLLAAIVCSGCVQQGEQPAGGETEAEVEPVETSEEASGAMTEIGTALDSLIAELEEVDESIG